MSSPSAPWWIDDLEDVCVQFQLDLSCLVDGELDEVAGGRAIAHLEICSTCSDFFQDMRSQVRAHRDLSNPEQLIEQFAPFLGADVEDHLEKIDLVHRLSTIFYQLGKSYVLNATDPQFRLRVFEKAALVDPLKTEGRGFVDGVIVSGRGDETGGLDWTNARHLLNGRLEKIENPLEKGRRLLEEAVATDETNDEAKIYLAYLDSQEGRTIKAATAYRRIFRTAFDPRNRAFAANQLGLLLHGEGETRKAIACNRWIVASGVADEDPRFFFARFNVGLYYAELRDVERSVAAFRGLLDVHPDRVGEVAELFLGAPFTRAIIDHTPGFADRLLETCPELFSSPDEVFGEEVTQ